MVQWFDRRKSRKTVYDTGVTELKDTLRFSLPEETYNHFFNRSDKVRVGFDEENLRIYFIPNSESGYHIFHQRQGYSSYFQVCKKYFKGHEKAFLGSHKYGRDEVGLYIQGVR